MDEWCESWRRTGADGPWWLWYRRGALLLAEEPPAGEGYRLGDAEKVPDWRGRDVVLAWVVDRAGRLECLPEENPGQGVLFAETGLHRTETGVT